jgi:hypothetical protein
MLVSGCRPRVFGSWKPSKFSEYPFAPFLLTDTPPRLGAPGCGSHSYSPGYQGLSLQSPDSGTKRD